MLRVLGGAAAVLLWLLWWFDPSQVHLPLCWFHTMTGLACPGCGATRATHALLHGELGAAWRFNALWVGMLPIVCYAGVSELRQARGKGPLPGDILRRTWFWVGILSAASAFFVLRNWG